MRSEKNLRWVNSNNLRSNLEKNLFLKIFFWEIGAWPIYILVPCVYCMRISTTLFIKGYLVFAKLQSHDSSDGVDCRLAGAIGYVFVQGPCRRHTRNVYNGASTSSLHHTLCHHLYLNYILINFSLKTETCFELSCILQFNVHNPSATLQYIYLYELHHV